MNLDILYMGALYFNNDIVPKYIHLAFGLATAFLLYRYLKKRISPVYGLLGVLFFLSVPIIVKLATTVYVDLGLVFFTTASVLLIFKWCENQFASKYLILAGICCGLAVGTKYNGLLVLFLLTFLVPFLYLRESGAQQSALSALKYAAIFFFCTLLLASPWFIRNSIWTGNPIYPLYDNVFNPALHPTSTQAGANNIRGVFATRYALYGESLWQLLALPVRIFFEGVDGNPRFFDGRLNPFLLILPCLCVYKNPSQDKRVRTEIRVLLFFSILYFLFAFNTSVLRIRYLVPIVPFLVILSIYGLHHIAQYKFQSSPAKLCAKLPDFRLPDNYVSPSMGCYLTKQYRLIILSAMSGVKLTRDEYLVDKLPEFKVMKYANNHLSGSSKILCVFMGKRGYYLDYPLLFDNNKTTGRLISSPSGAWHKR